MICGSGEEFEWYFGVSGFFGGVFEECVGVGILILSLNCKVRCQEVRF